MANSEPKKWARARQKRIQVVGITMARLVGGTGPVQDATAEVQSLADQVKSVVILRSPINDNEIARVSPVLAN